MTTTKDTSRLLCQEGVAARSNPAQRPCRGRRREVKPRGKDRRRGRGREQQWPPDPQKATEGVTGAPKASRGRCIDDAMPNAGPRRRRRTSRSDGRPTRGGSRGHRREEREATANWSGGVAATETEEGSRSPAGGREPRPLEQRRGCGCRRERDGRQHGGGALRPSVGKGPAWAQSMRPMGVPSRRPTMTLLRRLAATPSARWRPQRRGNGEPWPS